MTTENEKAVRALPCPFCGGEVDPEGWLDGSGEQAVGYIDRVQLERWEKLRGSEYASKEIGYIGFSREPFQTELTDCTLAVYTRPSPAANIQALEEENARRERLLDGVADALGVSRDIWRIATCDALVHYVQDTVRSLRAAMEAPPKQQEQSGEAVALPGRDVSKPAEQQGMFRKFEVSRVDGSDQPGGKHHGCEYFVLDVTHDQHAKAALDAYAEACKETHPELSRDMVDRYALSPAAAEAQGKVCMDVAKEVRDVTTLRVANGLRVPDKELVAIVHQVLSKRGERHE
jgi:hypothetical protein